jgi:hypothetical protein
MAADSKVPEWKQIMDQQKAKFSDRSEKLRAARIARDAAMPPPAPVVKKTRAKKVKVASA